MVLARFGWVLGFTAACASSPTTQPPPPAASATTARPTPSACDGRVGFVIDPPPPIVAHWDGAVVVGGSASIAFRNCGSGPLELVDAVVERRELRSTYTFDARTRLAPGDATVLDVRGAPETARLHLRARGRFGATEVIAEAELESLDDPKRTAARDACLSQKGTFVRVGLLGREACDRPTSDAGHACTSRADCEGPCLFDRAVAVSPSTAGAPACAPGTQPKRFEGHCYERSLLFGCHPFAEEVTFTCAIGAVRIPSLCVD